MRTIVFDIETANTFPTLARSDIGRLELALVAIYDSETDAYTSYVKEELPALWPILERAELLVGFNSDTFDIPLLDRYYPGDLTKIPSLDLLVEVQKVLGRRIRLQSLAEATLGKSKKGSGLESVEWWKEGLVDKVREYCIEDVRITKELYDYARENKKLRYKDLSEVRDIKLEVGSWKKRGGQTALTHTLPL
ncbi:MAG: ribonuclease H-like domain-containing protein [Patescibacteria group bacterium]|nr:ribonuclease H-like domain-containing protein [Patescibacteria group bacterium]MDE1966357.1 ribonuclease H-like domain-containing protein [Patescibacteria group bacterium]